MTGHPVRHLGLVVARTRRERIRHQRELAAVTALGPAAEVACFCVAAAQYRVDVQNGAVYRSLSHVCCRLCPCVLDAG